MRLIDADALIMALRLEYPMMPMFKENQEEWEIKTEGYRKAEEVIRNAPTIEPKAKVIAQVTFDEEKMREIVKEAVERFKEEYEIEPKRGEWKRRIVDNGFNADWVCSECGYRIKTDFVDYNFCPNCGADMRERKESE